jgi:hypothetical protein
MTRRLRRGGRQWIDHTYEDLSEIRALVFQAKPLTRSNPVLVEEMLLDIAQLASRMAERLPELEEMLQRAEQTTQQSSILTRLARLEVQIEELTGEP